MPRVWESVSLKVLRVPNPTRVVMLALRRSGLAPRAMLSSRVVPGAESDCPGRARGSSDASSSAAARRVGIGRDPLRGEALRQYDSRISASGDAGEGPLARPGNSRRAICVSFSRPPLWPSPDSNKDSELRTTAFLALAALTTMGCSVAGLELQNYSFYGAIPQPDGARIRPIDVVEKVSWTAGNDTLAKYEGEFRIDTVRINGERNWLISR